MSNLLPFQAHVSLRLYGAKLEHFQLVLKAAFEQLAQGKSESNTVMEDQKAGLTFNVTAMNLDDNKPSPAIPPQA